MLIKQFSDGTKLIYTEGNFDKYMVKYIYNNKTHIYTDNDIFNRIKTFADINCRNSQYIRDAIEEIYLIDKIDNNSLLSIEEIVMRYNLYWTKESKIYWEKLAYLLFAVFYSEDMYCKNNIKHFGRRMKIDGIRRVLHGQAPYEVANLYVGKSAKEIGMLFRATNLRDMKQQSLDCYLDFDRGL